MNTLAQKLSLESRWNL